jgi:3-phosphoshikimate 1-carboxyvinyltransferase
MYSTCVIERPVTDGIQGEIQLTGSKSISNRLLIIDAICGNRIEMSNLSNADDTVFMQRLLASGDAVLDAGAGGTTYRFLTAYLSAQEGREVVLTGSDRMQQRPIKILVDALRKLGADISYENRENYPPLRIRGKKLSGGKIELPADTSSQYITALLLIAPQLEQGLELELTGTIVSVPYIRMTLRMMEYFGIQTTFEQNTIKVFHGTYQPKPFFVEGDWSAASYYYSMAILSENADITLHGLQQHKIQGDSVISDIAEVFGIATTYTNHAAHLKKIRKPELKQFSFDFIECPDLAQTVVTFCAALGVELHCKGLQTLRIKETDRIAALDIELQRSGLASLTETDSNSWQLNIEKSTDHQLNHASIHTYDDHRMAMAFAPLALMLGKLSIEEPEVVSKSYPEFWKDLEKLGFVIKCSE